MVRGDIKIKETSRLLCLKRLLAIIMTNTDNKRPDVYSGKLNHTHLVS